MKTASVSRAAALEMAKAGQSPWLDSISRQLISSGKLKSLIENAGLLGVTSNPTIFEKAISTPGAGYDNDASRLIRKGALTREIYDALTIADIQAACDLFSGVHKASSGEHGFVSLEVSPDLAHEENKTVEEAVRLFKAVNRPNVMIKVPATPEGVLAFRELTARGVNVNVTLIFSLKHYLDVLNAYIEGLEQRLKRGGSLSSVHSVASVFVSRYDTFIDGRLAQLQERETMADERRALEALKGKAAVANSKLIYAEFKQVIEGDRFRRLLKKGATVQKVLWGSTSVKNPAYSDLLYVEPLIGRETVNTMPMATLEAVLDHGKIRAGSVEEGLEEARLAVDALRGWGIDLVEIGQKLQHDGLLAFMQSFESLMKTIELMREARVGRGRIPPVKIKYSLPEELVSHLPLAVMQRENFVSRFFAKDPAIWKNDADHQKVILNRLGWLDIAGGMLGRLYEIDDLVEETRKAKIKDIVLLGMGGSSLAPEVMSLICASSAARKRFYVLDTTDPSSVLAVDKKIDLKKALFIVASKSGTTVETLSQYRFFYDRVLKLYGKKKEAAALTGGHFIAITDDGSRLEQEGYEKQFRRVFINPSDIGGRYSALSFFGMVPAALLGIDVRSLLRRARASQETWRTEEDPIRNDSFYPGVVLGWLAGKGKDKLTIWTSKKLASFGAWLEQLIAESTGKEARGIVPVDGEPAAGPQAYGADRYFLVLRLKNESDAVLAARVQKIRKAGFPVIEMEWPDADALGAEFLRWEIVTAVASAVMGVNPFDEPNVKESKDNTTRLLTEAEKEGGLKDPEGMVKVRSTIPFETFFNRLPEGGYTALLAYTPRTPGLARLLSKAQAAIRDGSKAPALAGFGPRYLHSIGQLYKGGPSKGAYVVFFTQDPKNPQIPQARFNFAQLKRAQAIGDAQALADRDRPVLTVDLGKDAEAGIEVFTTKLQQYFNTRT